ncbi:MAG: hypothetical protein AMK73_04180 [Planctomycetes bacterium SM23_32]|nr:MAG: hypothetical protein AMK73_04180 [Planctomycetes bacterium SM23_32]
MRKRRAIVLCLTVCCLAGCLGYAPEPLFRSDIKTIYVEAFDNRTFRRGLEVALTRAIADEIRLRTPFAFAPKERADSILSGELLDFEESSYVKSEDDRVLLNRVTARVRFRWRDRLTGRDIVPEQTVEESARIAETLEDSLFDLVFQETAQRVVERMQKSW